MQGDLWVWILAGGAVLLLVFVVAFLLSFRSTGRMPEERLGSPVEVLRPKIDESLASFEPASESRDSQRSITLQFKAREGDAFNYESTFGGRGKQSSTIRIVRVTEAAIQFVAGEGPDLFICVRDRRGFPADFLDPQSGRSIKDSLAEDVWDISNQLIFPDRPVKVGDTWEADDGRVRVTYRLIRTGILRGREVAEIHSNTPGYSGPIMFWVELATGMLMRRQYKIGTRRTVTERLSDSGASQTFRR